MDWVIVLIIIVMVCFVLFFIYFVFGSQTASISKNEKVVDSYSLSSPTVGSATPFYFKGIIGGKIGFSMELYENGNEIEGIEHYDNQRQDAIIAIKGYVDDNGVMTLYEYDGAERAGYFQGNLGSGLYYGTFVNRNGRQYNFSARFSN